MIFSTGLKKIYESISKQPKEKRAALFNQLQEKIISSPALAYKFDLLESVQNRKGSFDKDTAKIFFEGLKKKHSDFLKENNSVALFYKEERKLFEFFNINQKEVTTNKLDLIVNKKDNELNENIIIDYVTDNRLISNKERLMQVQKDLRQQFLRIRENVNEGALGRQLDKIKMNSKQITGEKRKLVDASINVIKEETYKDFSSAVNKAYKLRLLTEKIIKEAGDNEADRKGVLMTPEEKALELKGKVKNMGDLKYIKNIVLDVPDHLKKDVHRNLDNEIVKDNGKARETWSDEGTTEVVTMDFTLPIYPLIAKYGDWLEKVDGINNELLKLKRVFMNKFIYQQNITLLDPVDSVWNVSGIPDNVDPEKGAAGAQVEKFGCYVVNANFSVSIFVAKVASPEKYFDVAYSILKNFDAYIPQIDALSSMIDPEAQKELLTNTPKGRKTEYAPRSQKNKDRYKDTHGSEKQDKWTNNVFSGEAGESEVPMDNQGTEGYFDDKNMDVDDDYEFDFDANKADKQAYAGAEKLGGKKQRPA